MPTGIKRKITADELQEIVRSYKTGNGMSVIAKAHCIAPRTVRKLLLSVGVKLHVSGQSIKEDLTGKIFGRLTVTSQAPNQGARVAWNTQCSCGTKGVIIGGLLTRSNRPVRSCGCLRSEFASKKVVDLTGQRFGRLVVIGRNGKTSHNNAKWLCQCDCGNKTTVAAGKLKRETRATVSCGCYQQERKLHQSPDSVSHWINGTFQSAEKDCHFYVFGMANYAELSKPGIAISINERADDQYGKLHDFIALPRLDAWLIEQAVLWQTRAHHDCPNELEEWSGHSELRKLEPQILFGYAVGFHQELQSMGREDFAIQYLPTTSRQQEQLQAMKCAFVAA